MSKAKSAIAIRRWRLIGAAAALVPLHVFGQSGEVPYPERNITLCCPFAAGGPTDIAMRALAEAVSKILPRRAIIDNRPGAGGALAAQQMAQVAKPDGYTLAQVPLGAFRLPHMTKTPLDPLNDVPVQGHGRFVAGPRGPDPRIV